MALEYCLLVDGNIGLFDPPKVPIFRPAFRLSRIQNESQLVSRGFFTHSVLIESLSPQAAQLGIHFIYFLSLHTVRVAPPWGTWLRTFQWRRKVGRDRRNWKKKKKKPCTWRYLTPRPPDYKACATTTAHSSLLRCYSHLAATFAASCHLDAKIISCQRISRILSRNFFFRIRVVGVGTFPPFVFGFREPPMPPLLRLSRPHVLGIWTEHNSLTFKLLIDIVLQLVMFIHLIWHEKLAMNSKAEPF